MSEWKKTVTKTTSKQVYKDAKTSKKTTVKYVKT